MNIIICRSYFNILVSVILLALTGCSKIDVGVSKPFPDCFDGIQNQGEQGIDCGGPCVPCLGKVSAKIDGIPWESDGNVTSSINNNSIIILSANGNSSLSLIYTGPFVTGTFNLQSALYSVFVPSTDYLSNQGTITFSNWDATTNQVSGTFSFTAFESSGAGDTIQVTSGKFDFVPYQP